MATLTRGLVVGLLVAGCGKPAGLRDDATPLARIEVQISGDLTPLRPAGTESETPALRVALVWGKQWLPEPFCVLPAESSTAAAVIQAGCRDSFGFVPLRVAANASLGADGHATILLYDLPAADDMIGDVTARIAYGSVVVYDDRDGTGTLELRRSSRDVEDLPAGPPDDGGLVFPQPGRKQDLIYGASFISMTQPDHRIAFREGGYNSFAAFYPRSGCGDPPRGFSVVAAGGFSADAALTAVLMGKLPAEDPATCSETPLAQAVVAIPLQAPSGVQQVACTARGSSTTRYREPPSEAPNLLQQVWSCAPVPRLGTPVDGGVSGPPPTQLVVAGPPSEVCKGRAHYLLRGCEDDAECQHPDWDATANPPSWWPCPITP